MYAIVLNWNRFELTKQCVQSLQQCSYPDLKVIVVDNASKDQSGRRLRAEFPQWTVILNERNDGFARGCNIGIRAALEDQQCKYVLLINNDATLASEGLANVIKVGDMSRDIGMLGGKILQSTESKILWYAGGDISLLRGQAKSRGFGEVDHGQYDVACDVKFITGGLMLIKREVLEAVGLLPEEYFFGVEEWDYSLATRKAGFRLRYVPEFVAFHKGDGSHWNYEPRFVYNYYRNKLIFQEKYLPKWLFVPWKVAFVLYGKYWAKRQRQKLIDKYDKDAVVATDGLDFALREALRDHRTNILSEETLEQFDKKWQGKQLENGGVPKSSSASFGRVAGDNR